MFSSRPKITLHASGRIEVEGDVVNYGRGASSAADLAADALESWVRAGNQALRALEDQVKDQKGAKPERSPHHYRYLFEPRDGKRCCAGTMQNSRDSAYPPRAHTFHFFATVDAKPIRARPAVMARYLANAWGSLDAMWSFLREAESWEAIRPRLAQTQLEELPSGRQLAPELDAAERQTPLGDFCGSVFENGSTARLARSLEAMAEALEPFRSQSPETIPVTFRCPLRGSADDVTFQAAIWLDLLLAACGRRGKLSPTVFLDAPGSDSAPASMVVFLGPPDSRNFISLWNNDYASDYINDLSTARAIDGVSRLTPGVSSALADAGAPIERLLRSRWHA